VLVGDTLIKKQRLDKRIEKKVAKITKQEPEVHGQSEKENDKMMNDDTQESKNDMSFWSTPFLEFPLPPSKLDRYFSHLFWKRSFNHTALLAPSNRTLSKEYLRHIWNVINDFLFTPNDLMHVSTTRVPKTSSPPSFWSTFAAMSLDFFVPQTTNKTKPQYSNSNRFMTNNWYYDETFDSTHGKSNSVFAFVATFACMFLFICGVFVYCYYWTPMQQIGDMLPN
jgi:hypothetical protein